MSIKIINFDDMISDDLKIHYKNDNPLTIQHPSRCVLIGSSGAGKSNLLLNLLLTKDVKITYNRIYMIVKDLTEDKTKYLEKYFSDIETKIKKKTGETIKIFTLSDKLEDIPDLDNGLDKKMQNLLILDDLITVKNQKAVEDYYIRSRKKNTTCIYLTQSYFKVPKVIRLNSDYFFLFNVPSRRELTNLYMEFGGGLVDDQRTFNQMVRESTKNKSFMMIDNKTSVPTMKFRKGFDYGWKLPNAGLESDDEETVTKPTLIRIVKE